MRIVFILLISFYQKIVSPAFKNILGAKSFCRFSPSCSEYAKHAVLKHGVARGGYMSFLRMLSCQPFKT